MAAEMESCPGEQFLLERVRKIEALPPCNRPYDAVSLMESYRLQEEIAEALPMALKKEVSKHVR